MPRPLRLEFENAWYHVMNRGLGSQIIYKNPTHGEIFLELLKDATELFGIEIHAYCLMSNHYHLLIKTPRGNLSRAMRHINGVYTQRFNRLENKEGPLFRGRYKAILVDHESYLLQVSRYIHLNPVNAKLANLPDQYKWSSYIYYINKKEKPDWLHIDLPLTTIEYKKFVEEEIDHEIKSFYERKNHGMILGTPQFKENLLKPLTGEIISASKTDFNRTQYVPTMQEIIQKCIKYFNIDESAIYKTRRGKQNYFRKIAIYACRIWGSQKLKDIAKEFNIQSHALASNVVSEISQLLKTDKTLIDELQALRKLIYS